MSYSSCSLLCPFPRIQCCWVLQQDQGSLEISRNIGKSSRPHWRSHRNKFLILKNCMESPAQLMCFSDWWCEQFQTRAVWYLRSSPRSKKLSLHREFENRNNKANRLQHYCYCCCYYYYYFYYYLFSSFLGTVHWRSSAVRSHWTHKMDTAS